MTVSISSFTLNGASAVGSLCKFRSPVKCTDTVEFRRKNGIMASSSTGGLDYSHMKNWRRREIISVGTSTFVLHTCKFPLSSPAYAMDDYDILKEEVRKVLSKAKAAGVLRLAFHDAGTFEVDGTSGGMNGSIVYELDRPENTGLKKPLKILEKAKAAMEMKQPVSWADVIAMAGAEAIALCGGPNIPIQLGRIDSS